MTGFYSLLYANSKYKHKKPNFFNEIQAFKHLKTQAIYKKKAFSKNAFYPWMERDKTCDIAMWEQ